MKCHPIFSQAPTPEHDTEGKPTYCMPDSAVLCLTPSPLFASLLLKFLLDNDTESSKASPDTLRSYCI